jgi:hypothetical protein
MRRRTPFWNPNAIPLDSGRGGGTQTEDLGRVSFGDLERRGFLGFRLADELLQFWRLLGKSSREIAEPRWFTKRPACVPFHKQQHGGNGVGRAQLRKPREELFRLGVLSRLPTAIEVDLHQFRECLSVQCGGPTGKLGRKRVDLPRVPILLEAQAKIGDPSRIEHR